MAGLLKPIPSSLREEMSNDDFYKVCCITGRSDERIEWHHNLTYAGSRVNEKFCILHLLQSVHRDIVKYKEKCDWIMLNRASDEELLKYSKAINYVEWRDRLNFKYGNK